MSTGRSPFFCSAVLAPFSFPNSPCSSQLHPFRTLKGQWGTPVFLRRRVVCATARFSCLKQHRTLAIFGGCFRRLCQRPHRAFGSRSVPGTGTPPRHFLGAQARKSQRGAPPTSCHSCHCYHSCNVCLLKVVTGPPGQPQKVVIVVIVVNSWGSAQAKAKQSKTQKSPSEIFYNFAGWPAKL